MNISIFIPGNQYHTNLPSKSLKTSDINAQQSATVLTKDSKDTKATKSNKDKKKGKKLGMMQYTLCYPNFNIFFLFLETPTTDDSSFYFYQYDIMLSEMLFLLENWNRKDLEMAKVSACVDILLLGHLGCLDYLHG